MAYLTKAYTNLQQSKKLEEILAVNTADMCYVGQDNTPILNSYTDVKNRFKNTKSTFFKVIPCWSLAALLEVLPTIDNIRNPNMAKDIYSGKWRCYYPSTKTDIIQSHIAMTILLMLVMK